MPRRDIKDSSAHARVKFVIEVPAGSAWGATCSLSQIYDQAGRETANMVSQHLQKIGARIIGTPEVIAVLAQESD